MRYPYLNIDLDKIEENCRIVTKLCSKHGIDVIQSQPVELIS